MRGPLSVVSGLVLGLAVALGPAIAGADDPSADEEAIRAVAAAFNRAMDAGDAKLAAGAWTEDGILVTPSGRSAKGRAEIEKAIAAAEAGPMKGVTHKGALRSFHFIRPDVAVVDGEVEASGPSFPTLTATVTDILVKRDGKWFLSDVRAYTFLKPAP